MAETGPTVLYVEDEVLIQELGIVMLTEAGFSVVAHTSATAAMAELDRQADAFVALITDIDLGAGPNGWEVAKYARENCPDIAVIYVSGGSANDWPSHGVPSSAVLVKPYAAAQLVVVVANATVAHPAGDQTN